MRFITTSLTSLLALATSVTALPAPDAGLDISPFPRSILEERDTYDCKGSSSCQILHIPQCDGAANFELIRNDVVNYGVGE